jgi:predicted nucleic acid-binding protein
MSLRVFLDANALFTAAYNPLGLARLLFDFQRRNAVFLLTSPLAIEEAKINLRIKKPAALEEFGKPHSFLDVVKAPAHFSVTLELPPKDLSIFVAAVAAKATHLLSGDKKHFGRYFNKPLQILGVVIQTVREFLSTFAKDHGCKPVEVSSITLALNHDSEVISMVMPSVEGKESSRLLRNTSYPLDKLRANGGGIENINGFPFMLSVSRHENLFSATC